LTYFFRKQYMKNIINDNQKIDLSNAMKNIVRVLLKKGGVCKAIPGTKAYSVYLKKNVFNFIDTMFPPAISCVYGILFSNKRYVRNILKQNNIKVAMDKNANESYSVCITKDGYLNVLLKKSPQIVGDGFSSLKELLVKENLRRINNPDSKIKPIKINEHSFSKEYVPSYIPKAGEKIVLDLVSDLEEGATFTDVTLSINKRVAHLAKKILSLFPGLPYLSFNSYDNGTIGDVNLSLNPNIFFTMRNGMKIKKTAEVISDLMIKNQ
jgi:hypothetical protein